MDKHVKNGIISMSIWILFIIILWGAYLYITEKNVSYFLDEETGGFITAAFFIGWALIWFAIGRHCSRDYETKKQLYINKKNGIGIEQLEKTFKKIYFSDMARMLYKVFIGFVPCYVVANVRDTPTIKDYVFIGAFMVISMVSYVYYKKNRNIS